MLELTAQPIFGVMLCLAAYALGVKIKSKFTTPLVNPLVIAAAIIIAAIYVFKIPLENFMNGGRFVSMLLAPATAVIAVSMYRQRQVIKQNLIPVIVGCMVGAISSLASVWLLCKLFGLPEDVTMSLIPKSITTAIATELSARIGGIVPLTVAGVFFTGAFGAILSPYFIKWFRINNKIAAGLAIGASSHALGTSKAIEIGEIEGVMSGIAIGICGLATVIFTVFFG